MVIVLLVFLVLVFLGLMCAVSALLTLLKTGVPFLYTPSKDIKFIVKELTIKNTDVFFDLGSGYGKNVFLVASLSGAKVVGFELALWAHLLAVLRQKFFKSNTMFVHGDFFKANWSEASYVYAYLFPSVMAKVEQKFLNDAGSKTKLIVRDFPLPNLQPILVFTRPFGHKIFVYKKSQTLF